MATSDDWLMEHGLMVQSAELRKFIDSNFKFVNRTQLKNVLNFREYFAYFITVGIEIED